MSQSSVPTPDPNPPVDDALEAHKALWDKMSHRENRQERLDGRYRQYEVWQTRQKQVLTDVYTTYRRIYKERQRIEAQGGELPAVDVVDMAHKIYEELSQTLAAVQLEITDDLDKSPDKEHNRRAWVDGTYNPPLTPIWFSLTNVTMLVPAVDPGYLEDIGWIDQFKRQQRIDKDRELCRIMCECAGQFLGLVAILLKVDEKPFYTKCCGGNWDSWEGLSYDQWYIAFCTLRATLQAAWLSARPVTPTINTAGTPWTMPPVAPPLDKRASGKVGRYMTSKEARALKQRTTKEALALGVVWYHFKKTGKIKKLKQVAVEVGVDVRQLAPDRAPELHRLIHTFEDMPPESHTEYFQHDD
jgi:hypothetical protein